MSAAAVLADLKHAGATITVEGDKLRVTAPVAVPAEVLDRLRAYKTEVVTLLSRRKPEPAAAAMSREWAEGIARLQTMPPPANVPPRRWEQFIDDTARFANHWDAKAAALGWAVADLWGCHRDKPYERIDCAGLLWLLNGAEIVAMTAQTATIRTRTGAIQTYRRRSTPPWTGLAWELEQR